MACSGEPSLQNALELALRSLRMLPSHASREILILMGSLTTCDPGDISVTVQVSVLGSHLLLVTCWYYSLTLKINAVHSTKMSVNMAPHPRNTFLCYCIYANFCVSKGAMIAQLV